MSLSKKFNWDNIDDKQFEELVYEIVSDAGPISLDWREGPGDKGRDLQARFSSRGPLNFEKENLFFIEVKHYGSGVPATALSGALSWAQAKKPDFLLIVVSSHITTPCREHLAAWQNSNPTVEVEIWERKEVEEKVLSASGGRRYAVNVNLLPPEVDDLLPDHPDQLRTGSGETGLEMEFRYWITDEEIDKIDHVVETLESLKKVILEGQEYEHSHFELTELAVPNWITFLKLFKAESKLQVAIRDYLYALASGQEYSKTKELSEMIYRRASEVKEIGESAHHVD